MKELDDLYGSAPRWYWRVASRIVGWRAEVRWWALLVLVGFVVGLALGWWAL